MGVYSRPDSPWWHLYLENAPAGQRKEKTSIRIGKTAAQRRDSRALAETLYHQRCNEIATGVHGLPRRRDAILFSAWADWWSTNTMPEHRGAWREAQMVKTLRATFDAVPLSELTRDRVIEWRTVRRQAVSARTVNREIDVLKSMLRDAVPTHLSASPLVGMKRLPIVKPKRHLMTPAEELKLLPQLAADDRAIFLMGLDALLRLGDILDLRRDDDHGRSLYIRDPKDPKQSQPFEVPVSKRLRVALNAVPATDSPYYFPRRRRAETEDGRRMVIRSALANACRKAGIKYGRDGGIVFHWSTRRTGASRMIQRNVDIKTVQAVGHWKHPEVVLEIYAEATTAAMRRAVEVVGPDSRSIPGRRRK